MPTFIDIPAHFRSHDSRVHATEDNLLGPEDFVVDAYVEQVMTMPQERQLRAEALVAKRRRKPDAMNTLLTRQDIITEK
jgi:hypothetical protein